MSSPLIGTAGWSIPAASAGAFTPEGSHLERYARTFGAVEINSSFHKPHRLSTYQRWSASVPDTFRFAVKLPKTITHQRRLFDVDDLLDAFAGEAAGLGGKLEVVLVQLPPSFAFDAALASTFFRAIRRTMTVSIACEPRHVTWFCDEADACLVEHRVARVAAHPVLAPGGERPGGWQAIHYHRLHGAPRIYHSSYDVGDLRVLAEALRNGDSATRRWCMFDNTASGAATADALLLQTLLSAEPAG